jgi:hypothetical protein
MSSGGHSLARAFRVPSGIIRALYSARRGNRASGRIVRNYDLDFLKKFSMVIGILAASPSS